MGITYVLGGRIARLDGNSMDFLIQAGHDDNMLQEDIYVPAPNELRSCIRARRKRMTVVINEYGEERRMTLDAIAWREHESGCEWSFRFDHDTGHWERTKD